MKVEKHSAHGNQSVGAENTGFPGLCLRIPRLSRERKRISYFKIDGRFSGPFLKNDWKRCVWVLPHFPTHPFVRLRSLPLAPLRARNDGKWWDVERHPLTETPAKDTQKRRLMGRSEKFH